MLFLQPFAPKFLIPKKDFGRGEFSRHVTFECLYMKESGSTASNPLPWEAAGRRCFYCGEKTLEDD
jgi:hypothetical protein